MAKSRFSISKRDIVDYFEREVSATQKRVFNNHEIRDILSCNKEYWRLRINYTVNEFIADLAKYSKLKKFKFTKESEYLNVLYRYSWGEVPFEEVASHIVKDGYYSHFTALFMNGLTEQIPKVYYVNQELTPKDVDSSELSQEAIDKAFLKPARMPSMNYTYKGLRRITLLNSKYADHIGVIKQGDPDPGSPTGFFEHANVTRLERTLIDIAVRPEISGGVFEVLKAYELAAKKVSINVLVAMLKKLNYAYPFHQRIGFYMSKTGLYSSMQLKLVRKIPIKWNFYLSHDIKQKEYSEEWRIFYPKGL